MKPDPVEIIEDVLINNCGVVDLEDEVPYLADLIYAALKNARLVE